MNTCYYGTASNTATNACGRLLRVDDGTGYQTFAYDRLGNVAENTRTIALPFEDSVYNFRMLFEYDSWNRVQRIVYPDSEVVTYNYDLAGNLNRVHTYKANHRDTLIKSILYDEFGHRTQVNFGNGVITNYTYDILQRLSMLETHKPGSPALQKISYTFDNEDNITRVANSTAPVNGLGGAYVNTYNYDDLYRLTAANGSYSGNNTNYSLEMSYTPAGRLCGKIQDFTATANTYAYAPNAKPHAVRRYYNGLTNELYNLLWDANGNLAQQTVYSVVNNATTYQGMRYLQWDEDDRLNLVAGDGYLSYYAYGHDGNRAIKMTGNAAIDQTGTLLNSTNLENITIYPNEYLTVTQAEYTKYYYAGGNRIASKIGTGGFEKMQRLCTEDLNISGNANTLFGNALQQTVNITNQPNDEFPVNVCGGYSVATELLVEPLPNFYINSLNLNFTQNNLLQQFRQNLAGVAEAVYYFHSDHLGSASWITNNAGLPVQHLQYLPFGEHFVNERSTAYDERFTFTGKERDAETGYYYHGARFNYSDLGWLSVDPMADKYPSLSPYAYCAWNPIKLVDPEGREFDYSDLTKIQQKKVYEKISSSSKKSPLFRQLYQTLEKSNIVYSIRIGETQNSDPGQFKDSDKSITFINEESMLSCDVFIEELFHAYQISENKDLYREGVSFNYDFEAKLTKRFIMYELSSGLPSGSAQNMPIIDCIDNYTSFGTVMPGYDFLNNPLIMYLYEIEANKYSTLNKKENYGNDKYKMPTKQKPASLLKLFKDAGY